MDKKNKFVSRRFIIAVFCMIMIFIQTMPLFNPLPNVLNIGMISYLIIYAGYTTVEKIIMFIKTIKNNININESGTRNHGEQ